MMGVDDAQRFLVDLLEVIPDSHPFASCDEDGSLHEIAALLRGGLPRDRSRRLAVHLLCCGACREITAGMVDDSARERRASQVTVWGRLRSWFQRSPRTATRTTGAFIPLPSAYRPSPAPRTSRPSTPSTPDRDDK